MGQPATQVLWGHVLVVMATAILGIWAATRLPPVTDPLPPELTFSGGANGISATDYERIARCMRSTPRLG